MKKRLSAEETVSLLKGLVDQKRFVDIGIGVEKRLGINRVKLNAAVAELKEKGYKIYRVRLERVGAPEQFLPARVLGASDSTLSELIMVRTIDQKTGQQIMDGTNKEEK